MRAGLMGFEVVFIARASGRLQVLDDVPDADAATIAFHVAQDKLRQVGATGELVLIDKTNTHRLLLREALRSQPAQA
jgi:hypothetical protein